MFLAVFCTVSAQTNAAPADTNTFSAVDTNGIYYVSSGEKAHFKIYTARVFSDNNVNSSFTVMLNTSEYITNENGNIHMIAAPTLRIIAIPLKHVEYQLVA